MIRSALDAAKAAAWITRALHNTCRHRGAPLLLEDPRQMADALVKERRLPWRMSRWLDQRKLERARARADRWVRLTRRFVTGEEFPQFEVHMLLGHKHVGMTLWSIESLLHYAARSYKVVLHDDGNLTGEDIALVEEHLLHVTIIRKTVADGLIRKHLEHRPNCLRYRFSKKEATDHRGSKYDEHIFAVCLFDLNLLSSAAKILVLDCDVLFIQRPREIMDWAQDPDRLGCLYSIEQYVPMRNARHQITGYRYKNPLPTPVFSALTSEFSIWMPSKPG